MAVCFESDFGCLVYTFNIVLLKIPTETSTSERWRIYFKHTTEFKISQKCIGVYQKYSLNVFSLTDL